MGDLRPRSVGTPVASLRGPLGDFLSEVSLAPLLKQPGRWSDAAAGLQALQSGSALGAQRDPGRGRGGSPDGRATRQNPTGAPPKPRGAGQPPRPRSSPAACPASGGFSASRCKIPRWDPARRSGAADWTGGGPAVAAPTDGTCPSWADTCRGGSQGPGAVSPLRCPACSRRS